MARKLPALQRVLDAPSLYSVAYGEVASSIYFALGIIAFYALGLTPLVLLAVGLLFLVVALSYAEGTSAIPETGGAATFVRRAFNDLAGFATGWVLFLDYLIVIALSALFLPHYLGVAFHLPVLDRNPLDVVVGSFVVVFVSLLRMGRRPSLYRLGIVIPALDLVTQLLLVGLGFALVFSWDGLTSGISLGSSPSWHDLAFAVPLAMLAYTGLETVANYAEEVRRPGVVLPRSLFAAIGTLVAVYVLIAMVGLSAFPARDGHTELGGRWQRSPLMGIVDRIARHLPWWGGDALRVYVGISGALILLAAITTSISGFSRLAHSLGEHGMLPAPFGRLHRRTLVSPQAIGAAATISIALLVITAFVHDDIAFLAGLFSFGVLLAFTAAQLAVIKLRFGEPALERPYRTPLGVRVRGAVVPLPAVVGALATFAIWVSSMVTHRGARYGGLVWLGLGLVVFFLVRHGRGETLTERVLSPDEQVLPEVEYSRILVPMKLGVIGEEMVATAVRLAQDHGAQVDALHVVRVPLDLPLDAPMLDEEESAEASIAESKLLGSDHGVSVEGHIVRARAIGGAIVEQAAGLGADLIVLGSAPRWRRQSRFFSPTVQYVLEKAPCEVLIVAFPQGVIEAEEAVT
ncbi:MAG TPA: universal stress protein [Gaiellaceae bacterium]|nr:universal stress protein [Gaiellaceae bacterium]